MGAAQERLVLVPRRGAVCGEAAQGHAADLDDSITVPTAEGVELRLTLAGIRTRFIAGGSDLLIQTILTVILVIVSLVLGGGRGVLLVVVMIGGFAISSGYPIALELGAEAFLQALVEAKRGQGI